MTQRWSALTFLHWPYRAQLVQALLPAGLDVELYEGQAWVGLVPFSLSDIQWLGTPAIPWISRFPETNVRTYVRGPNGRPGVWFFTLDAERLIGVLGARLLYHLPYRWASMTVKQDGTRVQYASSRLPPFGKAQTDIEIETGNAMQAGEFDNFLTARFRLFAARRTKIYEGDLEHEPWPLQRARVVRLKENMVASCGLPAPQGEPMAHFSDGVTVRVDRLRRLKR